MVKRFTTHRIPLTGERTLLARVWPGDGSPIVFLHGIFGSSESWDGICSTLDRPCIAFDLPGFGGSDLPSAPDVSAYAGDVAAALRALGVDRFELVGHSFGGAVAAALADMAADKVTSLTLLAPAGFGRIAMAETLSAPGLRSLAGAALPWFLRHRHRYTEISEGQLEASRVALEALVAAGRAPLRRADGYRGPVTAVWGTDDRVVRPRHSRDVVRAYPQTSVHVWDGMGHHPLRQRPGALLELLETGRTTAVSRRPAPAPRRARLSLRPAPAPRFA